MTNGIWEKRYNSVTVLSIILGVNIVKKVILILLFLILTFSIISCNGHDKNIYGRWERVSGDIYPYGFKLFNELGVEARASYTVKYMIRNGSIIYQHAQFNVIFADKYELLNNGNLKITKDNKEGIFKKTD